MRMTVAVVICLCLAWVGLCSDIEWEKRAKEEELLSGLLWSSKVKRTGPGGPLWRLSLLSVCRRLGGADEDAERDQEYEQWLTFAPALALEELSDLHTLCRILQPRQLQDVAEAFAEFEGQGETALKRKSPYILKRQVHSTKTRRPYILRRSALY